MFFDWEIRLRNMNGIKPVAVSEVSKLGYHTPVSCRADKNLDSFKVFSVVVSYPGDLQKTGHVKKKLVFAPEYTIGFVGYQQQKNVTDVQYLFKVTNPFFAEDVYFRASNFFSLMTCSIEKEQR